MANGDLYLMQAENNRRFAVDSELGTETCAVCTHVMEERWSDLWYVLSPNGDDQRMIDAPIQGPGQRLVCSKRCLTQLVFDTAPEEVKSLMQMLARQIHDWSERVNLKSMEWSLRHSYLTFVVSHLDFVVHNDEMDTFAKDFLGREWRDQEYPAWMQTVIDEMGVRHGTQGDPATGLGTFPHETPRALPIAPAKPVVQVVAL